MSVRQLSGLFGLGNNWCKLPLVGQPAARLNHKREGNDGAHGIKKVNTERQKIEE